MTDDVRIIFRRVYTTALLNSLSDAVSTVVLPLAFYARTGSVALAASLAAATTLPQLVLALPLGAAADRLPRRPAIITAHLVESGCLLLLALVLALHPSWIAVVVIGAARGTVSQFGEAAAAGYIPQVLGREHLLRYHSRVETVEGIAAIVGPSLAGGAVWLVGPSWGIVVPALLSACIAVLYGWLPQVPGPVPHGARAASASAVPGRALGRLVAATVDGLRYVGRSRVLLVMLLAQAALGATTTTYVFGVVAHLRGGLALSSELTGLVMSASGVGGLIASLLWERIVPLARGAHLLLGAFGCVGLILSVFTLVTQPWLAALLLLALDAAWVAIFIYSGTIEQYVTDDDMLARVDSLSGTVFLAASMLASASAARIIPALGVTAYLVVCALTCLPVIIGLALLARRGAPALRGA